ncbi:hypothetical protein PFWH6_3544 [Pseudomonas fluorescens WH6]|nr:hypothetical protein PFWH6_3544 [Pseudomonas fluorescens WH6]
MSLFGMLVRASRTRLAVAIGASLVCGLANVLLVALINQALNARWTAWPATRCLSYW